MHASELVVLAFLPFVAAMLLLALLVAGKLQTSGRSWLWKEWLRKTARAWKKRKLRIPYQPGVERVARLRFPSARPQHPRRAAEEAVGLLYDTGVLEKSRIDFHKLLVIIASPQYTSSPLMCTARLKFEPKLGTDESHNTASRFFLTMTLPSTPTTSAQHPLHPRNSLLLFSSSSSHSSSSVYTRGSVIAGMNTPEAPPL